MVKLCCCAMNKAEAALEVLLKCFRDVDEELLLWEHVVRYQRTRASGSAHGLWRGADNDDLVRRFVGQVGNNIFEKIAGGRYVTNEPPRMMIFFWDAGVVFCAIFMPESNLVGIITWVSNEGQRNQGDVRYYGGLWPL